MSILSKIRQVINPKVVIIQPSTKNNTNLYNQVLRIIQIAVKNDVKSLR